MSEPLFMKKVYVASPLASSTQEGVRRNKHRAQMLCLAAMKLEGVAAYAPHGFYPDFLDDADPEERELGRQAGMAWLEDAHELWVYGKAGISGGMREEMEIADELGIKVVVNPPVWDGLDLQ